MTQLNKNMTFSQEQKDLIFGTLLGDGNLATENDGRTWRYCALHKEEHKEYLDYKYEILKDFCGSPPIYGEIFDERTGKIYKRHYFNTLTSPSFCFYGNMFYVFDKNLKKFVKFVPKKVEKFLTPRAVAYWYMDDGALKWLNKSNAMRLCTESFKQEDVQRLRKALFEKFGIVTTQVKKTNNGVYVGDRISIPEDSSTAFRELIKPYLVDCMKYKVSNGNKGHL